MSKLKLEDYYITLLYCAQIFIATLFCLVMVYKVETETTTDAGCSDRTGQTHVSSSTEPTEPLLHVPVFKQAIYPA